MWDRVPSELHYTKHSWEVLGPHLSVISLVIHLEYLYTVFQVERIRCSESLDAMTDLLDSAMQIVLAVTDFAKQRDQESSIRKQYTWIVSNYNLFPSLSSKTLICSGQLVSLLCSPGSRRRCNGTPSLYSVQSATTMFHPPIQDYP